MQIKDMDATVVVALITLVSTFVTVIANKNSKKQDTIIEANDRLMAMLINSQNEIKDLKEQHAKESERLEKKIVLLTQENQELRNEVCKLNNYLIKLGINV